ncbi:MAG: paraquat-inducible protein A [Pseudomonadota bacterium]
MALAVSALLLLVPGYLMPLLRIPLGGATQELYVHSAVAAAWGDAQPLLAVLLAAMLLVFPLLRLGLVTLVLASVRSRRTLPRAGTLFRWAEELRLWCGVDVFVIAMAAVYLRLQTQITAEVALGGWALAAAAAASGFAASALNPRAVWRAILPDHCPGAPPRAGCRVCERIITDGANGRCPRCGQPRQADAVIGRTSALILTGVVLFIPSYLYPMSIEHRPTGESTRTILSGINRLLDEGFYTLAALLVLASVVVPALKLAGLSWMTGRARDTRTRGRVFRTRLHRGIHEIGRWSMIDPFIAAGSAGLVGVSAVADIRVGAAATPFALVVAVSMLASRSFDPRLMWRSTA